MKSGMGSAELMDRPSYLAMGIGVVKFSLYVLVECNYGMNEPVNKSRGTCLIGATIEDKVRKLSGISS